MFKPSREQQRAYIRGIRNRIRFTFSMLVLRRIYGLNSELWSGFPSEGAATSGNSNKGVGFQCIVQSKLRDAQSEPCWRGKSFYGERHRRRAGEREQARTTDKSDTDQVHGLQYEREESKTGLLLNRLGGLIYPIRVYIWKNYQWIML